MGKGSRLTCRQRHQPPSPAARTAIARIQWVLEHGCSAQELAQAAAELRAPDEVRQQRLPLKLRP